MVVACNSQPSANQDSKEDLSEQSEKEIWETDLMMSDLAIRDGFNKALIMYADDSLVKPKEGELPVIGKSALENYYRDREDTKDISWKPFKVEAAKSGELGYSLGNWTFVAEDTTYYGNYYTIWKKQTDGKWKWVVDGGNGTPAPQ